MRILYIGKRDGTALQRAQTLSRLGHEVTHVNPEKYLPEGYPARKFHWETGGLFAQTRIDRGTLAEIGRLPGEKKWDLAWVDSGRYVGPSLIENFKKMAGKVVNYNADDPFGIRDRFSWSLMRKSVPNYDLLAVVRPVNVEEAMARGAKDAILVVRGADEVAHRPREIDDETRAKSATDVLFVGTWFPERGPFMKKLVSLGVPLSIYGAHWDKAREWPDLKPCYKGAHLGGQDEYAIALQCSKIALGLLSKGNRDLHTHRSSEIPALGALFCAERTTEHLEMYKDGEEAVFWDDVEECAKVCNELLADEPRRVAIAAAGHARVRANGAYNEPTLSAILDRAFKK